MKIIKFFNLKNNSKGITLVETVMAIGVTVILLASISFAIYRVFDANWRGTTHMVAVKEVENAIHYISRDAERAQFSEDTQPIPPHTFDISPGLVLIWDNEFDNNSGTVIYTPSGDKLIRTFTDNNGQETVSTVAEHIDFAESQWWLDSSIQSGISFSCNITASVNGTRPSTETRSLQVIPRSKSQ